MSKTAEIQVIQTPIQVQVHCPKCQCEHNWTYEEFCNKFGEPCDWNYNKTNCDHCGEGIEFYGSDW